MTDLIEHKTGQQLMLDTTALDTFKEIAKLMSQATVQLPDHFKGKPADCLAVVMQSAQWGMNPFVVAQKTHVINGTLGYEAQLVNAVVSSSNAIQGRFKYEYKGSREDWQPKMIKESRNGKDTWKPVFSPNACVRVGAVISGETEVTWGEWIYPCDQSVFNSPLWRTNPKQQSGYLAVKFWTRFYTPDVLLGVYTPDELEDSNKIKDVTPPPQQAEKGSALDKLQKLAKPRVIEQQEEQPIEMHEIRFAEFRAAILDARADQLGKMANHVAVDEHLTEQDKGQLIELIKQQREVK